MHDLRFMKSFSTCVVNSKHQIFAWWPVFLCVDAAVQVACSNDVVFNSPSNATSNGNGVYLVVLLPRPSPSIVASVVSNCRLFVRTPLSTCNPSLPSAALVSSLRFVRSVQVGFAWITYMVATGFTLQAWFHGPYIVITSKVDDPENKRMLLC